MNLPPPIRFAGFSPLAVLLLIAAGCATPGPNHVYTLRFAQPSLIRDSGPAGVVDLPSFTTAEDQPSGLAYDPYTDHLFLRLQPGNRVRVLDRPDRSIKREFNVPELESEGGGDLAVRPRDGHLFFACPPRSYVVETDRFGRFLRRIELEELEGFPAALAYDAHRHRLLVATSGAYSTLSIHDLEGRKLQASRLGFLRTTSLAYDPVSREVHASVLEESAIVVLTEDGRVLRRSEPGDYADFLDLGQRSFIRVF